MPTTSRTGRREESNSLCKAEAADPSHGLSLRAYTNLMTKRNSFLRLKDAFDM